MTDTMGRMHSDAQFAGSSSVPAHVDMMGFLGIGNNPMVGCTVACAVDVATALVRAARLSACTERRRLCPLCFAIIFRLRERSIVISLPPFCRRFPRILFVSVSWAVPVRFSARLQVLGGQFSH